MIADWSLPRSISR